MAHEFLKEEPKEPIKTKLVKIQSKFLPGRLGLSFYIGRRELFVGLEVSRVVIPSKVKRFKRKVKKAAVTFVPTRE